MMQSKNISLLTIFTAIVITVLIFFSFIEFFAMVYKQVDHVAYLEMKDIRH